MQFLLPLYLTHGKHFDLALVIDRATLINEGTHVGVGENSETHPERYAYWGSTVLEPHMVYRNCRLIGRVRQAWLASWLDWAGREQQQQQQHAAVAAAAAVVAVVAQPQQRQPPRPWNSFPQQSQQPQRQIYVNFSFKCTEADIVNQFSSFGGEERTIQKSVFSKEDKKLKGFAFITYAKPADASEAINRLHGFKLKNYNLKVSFANQKPRGGKCNF
jgi:hypothetical protein